MLFSRDFFRAWYNDWFPDHEDRQHLDKAILFEDCLKTFQSQRPGGGSTPAFYDQALITNNSATRSARCGTVKYTAVQDLW